jgi:hypothetical protein
MAKRQHEQEVSLFQKDKKELDQLRASVIKREETSNILIRSLKLLSNHLQI